MSIKFGDTTSKEAVKDTKQEPVKDTVETVKDIEQEPVKETDESKKTKTSKK